MERTTIELSPAATLLYRRVIERLAPLELEDQLIHGDLTGNVLLDADDQPAVIDFSPYLRPARYADPIVIGDALLWEGADLDVLDLLGSDELSVQLLLRALVFRPLLSSVHNAPGTRMTSAPRPCARLARLLTKHRTPHGTTAHRRSECAPIGTCGSALELEP